MPSPFAASLLDGETIIVANRTYQYNLAQNRLIDVTTAGGVPFAIDVTETSVAEGQTITIEQTSGGIDFLVATITATIDGQTVVTITPVDNDTLTLLVPAGVTAGTGKVVSVTADGETATDVIEIITVIMQDLFTGTNGDLLAGRTPDTQAVGANTWANTNGTSHIQNNALEDLSNPGGVPGAGGRYDIGTNTGYRVTINVNHPGSTGSTAICFRIDDTTNSFWAQHIRQTNELRLRNVNSAVLSELASVSLNPPTIYEMTLEVVGNTARILIDGVEQIATTAIPTNRETNTYVGFRFGDSTSSLLDYTVQSL